MVKRKRYEDSLEDKLAQYKTDLFRALKKVKGFERQRLSRRIHEKGIAQDAKEKFELQVAVLKVRGSTPKFKLFLRLAGTVRGQC